MSKQQSNTTNHEEIAPLAFRLWDEAGRPPGCHLYFWLTAERRVLAARRARADKPSASEWRLATVPSAKKSLSPAPVDAARSTSVATRTNRPADNHAGKPDAKPAMRSRHEMTFTI
jgi:hypothetical protein